jgi:hypothetical protein
MESGHKLWTARILHYSVVRCQPDRYFWLSCSSSEFNKPSMLSQSWYRKQVESPPASAAGLAEEFLLRGCARWCTIVLLALAMAEVAGALADLVLRLNQLDGRAAEDQT